MTRVDPAPAPDPASPAGSPGPTGRTAAAPAQADQAPEPTPTPAAAEPTGRASAEPTQADRAAQPAAATAKPDDQATAAPTEPDDAAGTVPVPGAVAAGPAATPGASGGDAETAGVGVSEPIAARRPCVAAFDFDGTLARRDTLVPFLRQACGNRRLALGLARTVHRFRDRDDLKLALLAGLFRGWTEDRLLDLGRTYAAALPELFRPEIAERVRWHQAEGHAVVIVSASLAAYLRPLAETLGLDDVLAVELVVAPDGTLTGAVAGGANTRGPGKVERLRTWLDARFGPGAEVELWAYGDSDGDEELLALADHPTWVGKRARSR